MTTAEKSAPHRPNDLKIVNGTVLWSLNPGEIARRINVDEFEYIANAKGVYVQDGIAAVLTVDGKIQTKLSSGVYYFNTKVENVGGIFRHIWRFFTGQRHNGTGNAQVSESGRLGSELQNLSKEHYDVILVYEAAIPLVFGGGPTEDGYIFKPYTIKAGITDVEVAISMQCEIDDIVTFSRNYLTKNNSFRVVDLQLKLHNPLKNTLQNEFAYEKVDTLVLSPELVARIKKAIIEKAETVLYGIRVKQVIDVTADNEDFERFRGLERKLSLSNKELEYLIRTNDFKNRLTAEQNSQTIREARSEEDLRYALNLLNKDKLIHDDEMEAFCQLLASQKKIREAKTEDDLEAALLKIKETKLIRDDDFADIEQEVKKHGLHREEEFQILQYQSLRRSERERISVQSELRVLLAKAEKEGEQAEYEAASQEQEHKHGIQESEAAHQTRIAQAQVNTSRVKDDYDLEKHNKIYDQKNKEEHDKIKLAEQAQEVGLKGLRAIYEEKRKDKAQDYQHELEKEKIKIELEKAKTDAFRGFTAEQIASIKLDNLSPEAQVAMAQALSSQKEIEWLKIATEERVKVFQNMAEQAAEMSKDNNARNDQYVQKMLDFATNAIKTNAGLVADAVAGQQAQAERIMSGYEKISTHRIGEVEQDKQEAKENERHAQSRLDHTQDSALYHTTRVTEAKVGAEALKSMNQSPIVYQIVAFKNLAVGLADLIAMINAGTVKPDNELLIDGSTFLASERRELADILYAKYHAKCPNPNCGADGYKGMECPECGTLIK